MQQCNHDSTFQEIIDKGTHSIHVWKKTLQITGGDLSADKSMIAALMFDHNTFRNKRDNNPSGVPRIIAPTEYTQRCTYDLDKKGCTTQLISSFKEDSVCFLR